MGSFPPRLNSSSCSLSFLQKVEALACALTQRGFGKGDVIAVLLPNCIQVQTCSACTYMCKSHRYSIHVRMY